jgi:hypothetical protein
MCSDPIARPKVLIGVVTYVDNYLRREKLNFEGRNYLVRGGRCDIITVTILCDHHNVLLSRS